MRSCMNRIWLVVTDHEREKNMFNIQPVDHYGGYMTCRVVSLLEVDIF